MNISKAVITVAGREQRTLPLQSLIDQDGTEKSILQILVEEVIDAGVEEICIVARPGDERAYVEVAGEHAGRLHFVHQAQPLGYGHAVYCARQFVGSDPFLHLVGDHLYVSHNGEGCAQRLVGIATAQACAVSAVQATRESLLPYYGAVGGRRQSGSDDLYQIDTVCEKPTPTEAEQRLIVPGLRAGHYLCFFGMHVLTPTVMEILGELLADEANQGLPLSTALDHLARREQYLALVQHAQRFDVGVKYGLLSAQVALALRGKDRDEVLTRLLELLAVREMRA